MDDHHISPTSSSQRSHKNEHAPDAHHPISTPNPPNHASSGSPSESILKDVAKITVLDVDGNEVLFEDVYKPSGQGKKKRTLIIFVRHFFCGVSTKRNERARCSVSFLQKKKKFRVYHQLTSIFYRAVRIMSVLFLRVFQPHRSYPPTQLLPSLVAALQVSSLCMRT